MNRFFSKLDLRDIKIDPTGSRFPPDADEMDASTEETESTEQLPYAAPEVEDAVESDAPVAETESLSTTSDLSYRATTTWSESVVHTTAVIENGHVEAVAVNGFVSETVVDTEFVGVTDEVLKVSARSRPSAVAGAIAGVVRECGRAEVQAIGAGATNQAVKAVAIARDYLRETGIDAVCLPAFIDVTIENEDRTAIRLVVEAR